MNNERVIKRSTIEQIKPLTSLRGIAAIVITIHHFSLILIPKWGEILSTQTRLMENCYLCVDLFFILSGFILSHVYISSFQKKVNPQDYKIFLFSRFARIYPLHAFMLSLFVGLELIKLTHFNWLSNQNPSLLTLFDRPFTGANDFISLFTNIFLLQAIDLQTPPLFDIITSWNQPAWSISAEFIIYLIFPFLLLFLFGMQSSRMKFIYVLAWLTVCLVFISGKLNHSGIPSLVRCLAECILGIITYKLYRQRFLNQFLRKDWSAIAIFISILLSLHFGRFLIALAFPLFSLLILSLSQNRGLIGELMSSSVMVFLGTISYSIYLVHWFLQDLVKFVWKVNFSTIFGANLNFGQMSIIAIWGIMIVILFATFTYYFVESPMQKKFKRSILAKKYIY
ncbi:MAG: acyltransferase family protein [Xenococcaceae cyanobacterium]